MERPFELTRILLNDPDKWGPDKLNQSMASKRTQTIFLPTRIPVLLMYLTAHVENDGSMVFKKDVYNRDGAVLKALNGRFTFRKQPVAGRERL